MPPVKAMAANETLSKRDDQKGVKFLHLISAVIGVAMVAYHMLSTQHILTSYLEHQNFHLAFALVLLFLVSLEKNNKRWWPLLITFLILSLLATAYIHVLFDDLMDRLSFPIFLDVVVGTILIVLVLEATRQAFGVVLLAVAFLFLLYAFLGFLLPPPLATMTYSFGKLVSKLAVAQGMYGTILGISANYLFLFVIFGSVLQVSGAARFFMQIGKLLGKSGLAGGAALTAVISSALLGTLTGSVAANVVTSGSYSIPLMKKAGYSPEQAAAIEAAASTGGQIMPPIMGAGAFVMAGITEIPYVEIILAAMIPAILYFVAVGLYAQLQAMKLGIRPIPGEIDVRELLLTSYLFLVPIGILVILLVVGYTPMYVIFWTILSVIFLSMLRKETRPTLAQWVEGFRSGAVLGSQIAVSCAVIGLVVSCISLTGLGLKLPGLVENLSGGSVAIALILTAVAALILGCGMPTVAVYVMVVMVLAPVLVNLGIPLLTAHLFAFYFACMNFVTLPVAIGALIASKVAGANFTRTGIESMKAAFGGFVVPFLMILVPALVWEREESISGLVIVIQLASSLVILVAFEILLNRHFLTPINIIEGIGTALTGVLLFAYLITKTNFFLVGFAIFIALTLWQYKKRFHPDLPEGAVL